MKVSDFVTSINTALSVLNGQPYSSRLRKNMFDDMQKIIQPLLPKQLRIGMWRITYEEIDVFDVCRDEKRNKRFSSANVGRIIKAYIRPSFDAHPDDTMEQYIQRVRKKHAEENIKGFKEKVAEWEQEISQLKKYISEETAVIISPPKVTLTFKKRK